jgi:hypothetical protein
MWHRARVLPLIALALAAAACGGERVFEPTEFVEEANAEGAGLELGEPLVAMREGLDVYELRLAGAVQAARDPERVSGSLIVAADGEAALAEFRRCERTAALACYRVNNIVLALEGEPDSPELAPLDAAVRALGER